MITTITMGHKHVRVDHINQPFVKCQTRSQAQLILVDVEPLRPWIPMLTWRNSFGAFTKQQVLHPCASFMPSFIFAGGGGFVFGRKHEETGYSISWYLQVR